MPSVEELQARKYIGKYTQCLLGNAKRGFLGARLGIYDLRLLDAERLERPVKCRTLSIDARDEKAQEVF